MKYWLLTTEFPPFFGGGISTYCRENVRMLSGKGYEVSVFLPDKTVKGIVKEVKEGVRVIRFSPYDYEAKEFLGYETLISYAFAQVLREFMVAEGAPTLIESQEYNGIAYFILLYKKLLYPVFRDIKVVVTIHAPSFVCLPYNQVATYRLPYFWIGEMEKFCLKAADLVIAPSDYMAKEIQQKAPEVDLHYSRVSNPFFLLPAVPDYRKPAQSKEFVFYGKASPLKGIFELLQFFREVWARDPAIVLRLLGGVDYYYHPEGRLMGDIIKKKYARYITNGQLVLEGSINPRELAAALESARAVIIPSRLDNLPYAAVECMAMGKVILGSDSGGHKELIKNGGNGFLFSLQNKEDFKQKLFHILSLDGESMKSIGDSAMDTIRRECDPERVLTRKEALFEELLSRDTASVSFPFLRQPVPAGDPGTGEGIFEEKGLLSVVVPYYNMGAYVDETVASLLNSTYTPLEIILVNDGSEDPLSLEKLRTLEQHPSIRIIHQDNEGLSAARNTGCRNARGEFLAFLDPDDRIEPEYYKKALEVLGHYNNVYFAGSWVSYFGNGRGIWPCFIPEPPFVLYHNMINTSSLIYKKRAFVPYGLNDKAMVFGMEDYDSLLGLLENGLFGIALPEPFFHYRVRQNSMARQFTRNKILYLYQLLAEKHKKIYSTFAAEVNSLLNSNGQGFLHDNPTLDLHLPTQNKIVKKILSTRGIQYIKQNQYLKRVIIKINQFFKERNYAKGN
ncbi:MAG TPA: glycosyltransferase [Puia sp.]|nr:glycosyltransferase [Puia sp.]